MQALTDTFNYSSFHCLVETKLLIHPKDIKFTIIKLPVFIMFRYLVSCLERILLKQAGQLTRTFILSAKINHQYERTHFDLNIIC